MRRMNWSLSVVLCLCASLQCLAQGVSFDLSDISERGSVRVSFRDSSYTVELDEAGCGVVSVPTTLPPGYATLRRSRGTDAFYLIPARAQRVKRFADGHLEFGGAGKTINEYLNDGAGTFGIDYRLDETNFCLAWDSLYDRMTAHLDSWRLPYDFARLERKRLYYVACNALLVYPLYHSRLKRLPGYVAGDGYYSRLEKCIVEDEEAFELWEYRRLYYDWIQVLSERNAGCEKPLDKLAFSLDYIRCGIRDARLAEYLTDAFFTGHVRHFTTEGLDGYLPFYDATVKNSCRRADFYALYNQHNRLAKGKEAPTFTLPDMQGGEHSLSDWRGEYVYIDVWATWCIPCCRELPKLRELEERFAGKPIRFVSISIDDDVKAWKSKVNKDKPGGIQLHVGGSRFRSDYKIHLIPRFILIDPQGRIADAQMTRPSDAKTVERLDALLQNR